jgi:4-amino-4-deoxy-L-arabinose transferase-like glycosyltransferase
LETVFVPILVAGFFTFGTVTLIASVFSVIQRKSQGILAGLFLLGTGFFIRHGWSQYADVPLCFFILSTVIVLMLKDRISPGNNGLTVMAGLMASMAAWTKNEGLLFVVAVVVARSVLFIYFRQFRKYLNELIFFLLGLIPVMVVLALFKLSYAPSGDELFLQPLSGIVLHLFDIARYTYLGKAFAKEMMHFGNNIVGLLLIYVYFVKLEINELNRPTIITVASILIIMLMGYFLVYILSPYDLKWHLSSSLERLLLQLWPVFLVFVFFVTKPFYFTRQNEK